MVDTSNPATFQYMFSHQVAGQTFEGRGLHNACQHLSPLFPGALALRRRLLRLCRQGLFDDRLGVRRRALSGHGGAGGRKPGLSTGVGRADFFQSLLKQRPKCDQTFPISKSNKFTNNRYGMIWWKICSYLFYIFFIILRYGKMFFGVSFEAFRIPMLDVELVEPRSFCSSTDPLTMDPRPGRGLAPLAAGMVDGAWR